VVEAEVVLWYPPDQRSSRPVDAEPAYRLIVEAVNAVVGRVPVVLGGSRATGQHTAESDYDVVVVVAAPRVPIALRRLARVARSLSVELGVGVSINPLPASRLKRSGSNLLLWKLCREGLLLDAPPGFRLPTVSEPITGDGPAISYLLSAALYLIEELDPAHLRADELPPAMQRNVRKALLHVAQVELYRQGLHAASLEAALNALGRRHLQAIAEDSSLSDAWFGVRRELLGELRQLLVRSNLGRSVSRNLQYAVLSALRGHARWWAIAQTSSIERGFADAIIALLCAIEPGGRISASQLQVAVTAIPAPLRPRSPTWPQLRGLVAVEWRSAHPLLSL
jgi:predicted nucleotidyltransferase